MSIPAPQSIQDGQQKQGRKDDKGDSKSAKVLRIGSTHEGPPSEDASDDPKDKNQQRGYVANHLQDGMAKCFELHRVNVPAVFGERIGRMDEYSEQRVTRH